MNPIQNTIDQEMLIKIEDSLKTGVDVKQPVQAVYFGPLINTQSDMPISENVYQQAPPSQRQSQGNRQTPLQFYQMLETEMMDWIFPPEVKILSKSEFNAVYTLSVFSDKKGKDHDKAQYISFERALDIKKKLLSIEQPSNGASLPKPESFPATAASWNFEFSRKCKDPWVFGFDCKGKRCVGKFKKNAKGELVFLPIMLRHNAYAQFIMAHIDDGNKHLGRDATFARYQGHIGGSKSLVASAIAICSGCNERKTSKKRAGPIDADNAVGQPPTQRRRTNASNIMPSIEAQTHPGNYQLPSVREALEWRQRDVLQSSGSAPASLPQLQAVNQQSGAYFPQQSIPQDLNSSVPLSQIAPNNSPSWFGGEHSWDNSPPLQFTDQEWTNLSLALQENSPNAS